MSEEQQITPADSIATEVPQARLNNPSAEPERPVPAFPRMDADPDLMDTIIASRSSADRGIVMVEGSDDD